MAIKAGQIQLLCITGSPAGMLWPHPCHHTVPAGLLPCQLFFGPTPHHVPSCHRDWESLEPHSVPRLGGGAGTRVYVRGISGKPNGNAEPERVSQVGQEVESPKPYLLLTTGAHITPAPPGPAPTSLSQPSCRDPDQVATSGGGRQAGGIGGLVQAQKVGTG